MVSLKNGIAVIILGTVNGMVLFGIVNKFETIRGFGNFLINPKLRKAIERAMRGESAIIEISDKDSKGLSKYYGKCINYQGQGFVVLLAVT